MSKKRKSTLLDFMVGGLLGTCLGAAMMLGSMEWHHTSFDGSRSSTSTPSVTIPATDIGRASTPQVKTPRPADGSVTDAKNCQMLAFHKDTTKFYTSCGIVYRSRLLSPETIQPGDLYDFSWDSSKAAIDWTTRAVVRGCGKVLAKQLVLDKLNNPHAEVLTTNCDAHLVSLRLYGKVKVGESYTYVTLPGARLMVKFPDDEWDNVLEPAKDRMAGVDVNKVAQP